VSADAQLAASKADSDKIELVCPNGHRTTHSLARVLRLNDAWCGTCGADISYDPLIPAARHHRAICRTMPHRVQ
jgi:hypothetical protein